MTRVLLWHTNIYCKIPFAAQVFYGERVSKEYARDPHLLEWTRESTLHFVQGGNVTKFVLYLIVGPLIKS